MTMSTPGRAWTTTFAIVTGDLLALAVSMAMALFLRWCFDGILPPEVYLGLWPALIVFAGLFFAFGLYGIFALAPADELRRLSLGTSIGFMLIAAATFLQRDAVAYSRLAFLMAWIFALALVPLARAGVRGAFGRRGWWGRPVVVIGAGSLAAQCIRGLAANPGLGLKPVAIFDDDRSLAGTAVEGVPVSGTFEDAADFAKQARIGVAILALQGVDRERSLYLWHDLGTSLPHIVVLPEAFDQASLWVEARDLAGMLGLEVRQNLLLPGPRLIKATLDLAVGILAAILALGPCALIALAVVVESRGGALYGQRRLGQGGRHFIAWKFRTMRRDADAVLAAHLAANPDQREEWERYRKLRHDPRITLMGRLLRKTSLDELPQLWNVLRCDMSLVGPRPIVDEEAAKYGDHYNLYSRVRPGLTGLWQVSGRNNLTYPERVALDAYYVRNWSVWLDLFILAKTVRVVARGEGAY